MGCSLIDAGGETPVNIPLIGCIIRKASDLGLTIIQVLRVHVRILLFNGGLLAKTVVNRPIERSLARNPFETIGLLEVVVSHPCRAFAALTNAAAMLTAGKIYIETASQTFNNRGRKMRCNNLLSRK